MITDRYRYPVVFIDKINYAYAYEHNIIMVEFCINQAFSSPFSFIWFYLHPRPHIWHIKPICDINEEKILKIAIFDILVVLWAYNCL